MTDPVVAVDDSVLASRAFDPATVKPGEFVFDDHLPERRKEKQKEESFR